MRYLVTGATGFVGGAVARQLRSAGHDVVALVRRPFAELTANGVEQRSGDIADRDGVRAAMRGADGVFHVAAWYRVGAADRREAERANVEGTRVVLEAMRDLGIAKGVYTSTLAVFGDTHGKVVEETYRTTGPFATVYDETKWRAHYEVALPLMERGLPLVIVQPGVVYGLGDRGPLRPVIDSYLARRLPAVPSRTAYCWGHVEDTAHGHILALDRGAPGESYIIAGPPHTLADALRVAEGVTGIPAPRLRIPGVVTDLVARVPFAPEGLRVLGHTYLGSNEKARRELGFEPRPLRDGFAEVLPAHLAELRARAA
jgi:nucleoside-diphosphate-sugar epimerase